ncbi:MAG: hypothetical protein UHK60_00565 [Acutalibacteraceae bacterium]|nr:hypothetical protein [Acutalibacteraceae bacterium]
MTAERGISVNLGDTLNIYAQSSESGGIIVEERENYFNAGIGGDDDVAGTINIHGGNINVTGNRFYARIGGNEGNVTIEMVEGFCSNCGGYQEAVFNEEDYVYEISNAGQLYWYAQQLNKNNTEMSVVLTNDIVIPENAPNWEPINASYVTFDGKNRTISGLKCIGKDRTYVGMFGQGVWWYEIKNLHITDSYFEGNDYVGVLAGFMNNGGSVTNCYVTNTTVKGDGSYVDGLMGYLGSNVIN